MWRLWEKFSILNIFYIYYLFNQDKGCNNGGLWSCLNGGTCILDGTCKCLNGYVGAVCSSCENIILYKFKFVIDFIYSDVGCLANGSLSCRNEGICMPNGLCDCKYGFGGSTCSDCLF